MKAGIKAYACKSSTREAEIEGLEVWSQPGSWHGTYLLQSKFCLWASKSASKVKYFQ